jgi:Na+/H+ antiporter NhaD/arsenite permease-like protein
MVKIAYVLSSIRYPLLVLATFLLTSALLSSVLDNLSVIVSLTPIATLLNNLGLIGRKIYFALLFGGVFGGNYTPIGSTANIVALSMVESRGIKTSWGEWLKISLISTTMQIVVSLIWLYLI